MTAVEQIRVDAVIVEDRAPSYSVYATTDKWGETLYIGCTNNLARRMSEHRRNSPWWQFASHVEVPHTSDDRADALAMEKELIRACKPQYNLTHGSKPFSREAIVLANAGMSVTEVLMEMKR